MPPPPQPLLFSCILVLFWLLDLFHSPSRLPFAEQWSVEPLLIWGDRGGLAGVGALVPPTRCTVTLVTGSDGDLSRLMVPNGRVQLSLQGDTVSRARSHRPARVPARGASWFWRWRTCQRCSQRQDGDHPARAGCRQCQPQVCPGKGQLPVLARGAAVSSGCATAWGLVQPVYSVAGADGLQTSGCRWFGLWRGWGHGDWKHIAQGAPRQGPRCPQPVPVTPPHRGSLPSPPPSCAWEPRGTRASTPRGDPPSHRGTLRDTSTPQRRETQPVLPPAPELTQHLEGIRQTRSPPCKPFVERIPAVTR